MTDTNTSLIKSICSDSLDLLSDYGEIILDASLESEVVQSIPVFGSIIKFSKIGLTIKDYLFVNKLKNFLLSLSKIETEQRVKFIDKNFRDKSKASYLGEKLINTIDKIDSSKKAILVGKAFNLYLLNHINEVEFYDLVYAVENFKLHYSDVFIEASINVGDVVVKDEIMDHFFTCGLFYSKNNGKLYTFYDDEPKYSNKRLTDLGKIFLEEIIEYDKDKLLKQFKEKIINIKPSDRTSSNWVFVKMITEGKFKEILKLETFNSILDYTVYSSFISNFEKKDFEIIARRSKDSFAVYKMEKNNN